MNYGAKQIPAKQYFKVEHNTRDLFESEAAMNERMGYITGLARKMDAVIDFYKNDGIIFYTVSFFENGHHIALIHELLPYSFLSGSEKYCIGIIKSDGTITQLFGGNIIGVDRDHAVNVFAHLQNELLVESVFGGRLFMYKY